MEISRWWSERSEREPPDRVRKPQCVPAGTRETGVAGSAAPSGADVWGCGDPVAATAFGGLADRLISIVPLGHV
jgi:hypothetical protein